jgi:hypothetical protein
MSDIDLLADAREWLSQQDTRPRTHCDRCHLWHPVCLVSRLVRLIDSRAGQTDHQGENLPERERTTLTAEERLAIREAADAYEENNEDADCERIAHTLRGLLDRTSDGGNRQ